MQVLEEQMQERVVQQRAALAEYERERAAVDAVVAQIAAEDAAESRRKQAKQARRLSSAPTPLVSPFLFWISACALPDSDPNS